MAGEADLLKQLEELELKAVNDQQRLVTSRRTVAEAVDFLFSSTSSSSSLDCRAEKRFVVFPCSGNYKSSIKQPVKRDLEFGTVFLRTVGFNWVVVGVQVKNVSQDMLVSDLMGSVHFDSTTEYSAIFECHSSVLVVGETNGLVTLKQDSLNPGETAYLMLRFDQSIRSINCSILCSWLSQNRDRHENAIRHSCECGRFIFDPNETPQIPTILEDYGSSEIQRITSLVLAVAQEQISFGLKFNQMSKTSCLTRIKSQLVAKSDFQYNEGLRSFTSTASLYEGCRVQVCPTSNVKAKIFVFAWSALQLQRFLENCVAPVLTQLDDIQLLPIGAIEFLKDQKVEKLAELDDQYGKILETLIAAAKNGNSFEGDRYRQLRTQLLENTVSYNEALLIDQ